MPEEWFYAVAGRQIGPVSEPVIRQIAESGGITKATLVWKEGMAEWSPAGKTPFFHYLQPGTPPPLPERVPHPQSYRPSPTPAAQQALLAQQVPASAPAEEPITCPRCGSASVDYDRKKFRFGKAVAGGVFLGLPGLLAGYAGKSKISFTCLKCGNTWRPGDQFLVPPHGPQNLLQALTYTRETGEASSSAIRLIPTKTDRRVAAGIVAMRRTQLPPEKYPIFDLCMKWKGLGRWSNLQVGAGIPQRKIESAAKIVPKNEKIVAVVGFNGFTRNQRDAGLVVGEQGIHFKSYFSGVSSFSHSWSEFKNCRLTWEGTPLFKQAAVDGIPIGEFAGKRMYQYLLELQKVVAAPDGRVAPGIISARRPQLPPEEEDQASAPKSKAVATPECRVATGTVAEQRKQLPPGKHEAARPRSRRVAGVLGIFLGPLGVHRFYLGFWAIGILQIVATFLTFGMGGLWGIVEGILILARVIRKDATGRDLVDYPKRAVT